MSLLPYCAANPAVWGTFRLNLGLLGQVPRFHRSIHSELETYASVQWLPIGLPSVRGAVQSNHRGHPRVANPNARNASLGIRQPL